MAVFLEIGTVRDAIVLAKPGSVAARKSTGTTVGFIGVACAQAAIPVTVEIEVTHHVAGPVLVAVVVLEAGVTQLENKAIHAVRAVVTVDITDFAVVAGVFVAFPKGVAVGVRVAEFACGTVQGCASATIRNAASVV